jgi:cytochrome c
MWQVNSGELVRTIYKHGWGVNVVRALPDGLNLLIGTLDGAVNVVAIKSGKIVRRHKPHEGPVLAGFIAPERGLAATGGGDGNIRIWSLKTWKLLHQHHDPYGPIWALSFAQNQETVLYGGLDDHVIDWDLNNTKHMERVKSKFPRRFQVTSEDDLGTRQFARRCSVCHTVAPDGSNRAGPSLYRIYGRRAGTRPGYIYSQALRNSDIIRTKETIGRLFNEGPAKFTPGSKMPLQRIQSKQERDALLNFLKEAGMIVKNAATTQPAN